MKPRKWRAGTLFALAFGLADPSSAHAIGDGFVGLGNFNRLGVLTDNSCRGVLYDDDIVITAAHCVDPKDPPSMFTLVKNGLKLEHQWIKAFKVHPQYSLNKGVINDIAVLITQRPFWLAHFMKPLHLARGQPSRGMTATIYSGIHEHMADGSFTLTFSDFQAKAPFVIEAIERVGEKGAKLKIKADSDSPAPKLCPGDSGSPMVMEVNSEDYLVGISSRTHLPFLMRLFRITNCAYEDYAYSTSVGNYHDWIIDSIRELRDLPPKSPSVYDGHRSKTFPGEVLAEEAPRAPASNAAAAGN